ncbi:hypothetical protein HanPSC8_Chr06g0268171 [Helianthus annuus]|nr:hypothetical protein HanPSC8_Chr06g0268171 [Helianthus annuus]
MKSNKGLRFTARGVDFNQSHHLFVYGGLLHLNSLIDMKCSQVRFIIDKKH